MLLMVEKGIRGGMWQAIYRYAKANKYIKNYDKNIKLTYLMYLVPKFLQMGNVSKTSCKWVKKNLKLNERFIKNYDENSNKGYLLKQMQST